MMSYISTSDAQRLLAAKLRHIRKVKKHSRAEAARRSGVPAATIRRFETRGEISLRQFLMLCEAYGDLDNVGGLLKEPAAATMDELIAKAGVGL